MKEIFAINRTKMDYFVYKMNFMTSFLVEKLSVICNQDN
jgi:hypothetical protein